MIARAILAASLALAASAAWADSAMPSAPLANTQLADVAQERKAQALMQTLRCLVCQGQSIADSDAELAADMRSLVRERIARGEAPASIRDWLVRRYGSWISYDPPLDRTTGLLWAMPLVLLAIGGAIAAGSFRRRR